MRCFFGRMHLLVLGVMLVGLLANTADAGVVYGDPGWAYTYNGEDADAGGPFESLDGTWDHDNGSDQWDGSGIGAGNPGGVSALSDPDGTFYLRMIDTGDPTQQGVAEPSNRKYFFAHDIGAEGAADNQMDIGVTLSFRARIPSDGPLGGISPGDGYHNHNGGKSVFTISQADPASTISFFLAGEDEDETDFAGPGLGMNSLDEGAGGGISGNVDWQGTDGTQNLLELDDPTEWHEFWVNIFAPGGTPGSHLAVIYADGVTTNPDVFNVTAGNGRDYGINYITMGLGSTPQTGGVDIDFFSWAPGILEPVPISTSVPGDANGDGKVNAADLNILGGNWQMSVAGGVSDGDFDESGFVNAADLNILGGNWQFGVEAAASNAAVPEPSSVALLFAGLLAVSGCLRKRR